MQTVCGLNFSRCLINQLYQDLELGREPDFSGSYLMNRERVGVPLRRALEDIFFSLPAEPTVMVVDFVGVEELTGSVAEEVGPKLFGAVETHRKVSPDKYLIYDNLSQEIRKELDAWFAKYDRCTPAFLQDEQDAEFPIAGALPPDNLLEALIFCYRHGPITSSELGKQLAAAAKKLAIVHRDYPWLLHRQKVRGDTPKSWQYLFIPLIPLDRIRQQGSRQVRLSRATSGKASDEARQEQ